MEYVHGGDVYTYEGMTDFSANINPLGVSDAVLRAAGQAVQKIGQYPDSKCRKLRRVLAEQLKVEQDCLMFGNGAAELIFLLVMTLRPKKALLPAPSFAEYKQALAAVGCEVIYYPLLKEHDFELNETYLEYLKPDLDLVFLCSPNNPVGNVIDRQLLLKILGKCRENQIRMAVDECFYEFLDTRQEDTLIRQVKEYPMLFILRAFTKMHAMAGLRLGYGISGDSALLERMEAMRQPWSVSLVAQEAGIAAALDTEWPAKTRAFLRIEREWLLARLTETGIRCYPPAANYIFFESKYDLYELLIEQQILIRDCSNYDGLTKGYYRIAVRTREENQKLVTALKKLYTLI